MCRLSRYIQRAAWSKCALLRSAVNLIASPRSGLRLTFLLFLALGFEFRVLLRSQDSFSRFHVFGLARIGATRLLMVGQSCVHLCLLIRCEVEARQCNRTRHLRFVPDLLCAVAMFACEHRSCRKESRRYYRNEFGHSGNVRHRYWDFHSKSLNESQYGSCLPRRSSASAERRRAAAAMTA